MKKMKLRTTATAMVTAMALVMTPASSFAMEPENTSVTVGTEAGMDPAAYSAMQYYVTADVLNVRSGPSTEYSVIGTVTQGQIITVKSFSNGWAEFKFMDRTGYVSAQYLAKC